MINRKIILGVVIMITLTTAMTAIALHQVEAVIAPEQTKRGAAHQLLHLKTMFMLHGGRIKQETTK